MTALIALLLLAAPPGDDKKSVKAVCPLDGTKIDVIEVTATNHWGGRDADGCAHAFKTTPMEFYVWVCPVCRFAGRKKDFETPLSEADRKLLLGALQPMAEIRKDARQNQIPGWVKFDLLAQAAALRKAPPEEVGRAYLNASWSCRQQGAVAIEDFEEYETFRTGYNLNQTPMQYGLTKNRTDLELEVARRLDKELEARKHERGLSQLFARYLAVYLFRKHGENAAAERWLAELEKLKGTNSVVDDAVVKTRALLPLERDFQKKAIEAYRTAYEGGSLDRKLAPEVAYLLGELHRRTGDAASALVWYGKAIESSDSEPLRKLATDQKARTGKP